MPRGRQPDGEHALSHAERQGSISRAQRGRTTTVQSPLPPADGQSRSRSQRWHDTVAGLVALQAEYATWVRGVARQLPGQCHRRGTSRPLSISTSTS